MALPSEAGKECDKALQALADSYLTVEQYSLVFQALWHLEQLTRDLEAARQIEQSDGEIRRALDAKLAEMERRDALRRELQRNRVYRYRARKKEELG